MNHPHAVQPEEPGVPKIGRGRQTLGTVGDMQRFGPIL